MKKTYVILSVFCCFSILFFGCKKTTYFDAKAEDESEVAEDIEEETNQETETPACNVYVYVYPKEGYETIVSEEPVDIQDYAGKININTASLSELMTLPGIGESKAQAIIAYRTSNGNFGTVEELMKIPGIKEGVYSQISDQIYVN